MNDAREALRLTAYLDVYDRWQRIPAYVELLRRARAAGISGATVLRGISGFGPRSSPRRAGLFRIAAAAPTIVTMVDADEQIQQFLAEAGHLLIGKLVTVERVQLLTPALVRDGRSA